MGVEPTSAGFTDARTVLKTGRTTGFHPPPSHSVGYAQPDTDGIRVDPFFILARVRTDMNRFQRNGSIPFYYWFLAGMASGILMGWFFGGFISWFLRVVLVVGVIAVIGLMVYLWHKTGSPSGNPAPRNDIPEGTWRTIDPSGGK